MKIKKTSLKIDKYILSAEYDSIPAMLVSPERLIMNLVNNVFDNYYYSIDDDGYLLCDSKLKEDKFSFKYQ